MNKKKSRSYKRQISNIAYLSFFVKKRWRMNNYEKIGDTVLIELPEEVDDYRA